MFDAFYQWCASILAAREYQFSRGAWVDTPALAALAALYVASIRHVGGPPPNVEDRRQRFQVLLLGPRETRSAAMNVMGDANILVSAAIQGIIPCGAANVRASIEPVGPGYTIEGRAWVQVDFEVLF